MNDFQRNSFYLSKTHALTNKSLVYIYTLDKRGKNKYINGELLVILSLLV